MDCTPCKYSLLASFGLLVIVSRTFLGKVLLYINLYHIDYVAPSLLQITTVMRTAHVHLAGYATVSSDATTVSAVRPPIVNLRFLLNML